MKDEPNPAGPEIMQAGLQVVSAPVANMGMGSRMNMSGPSGMRDTKIEEEY